MFEDYRYERRAGQRHNADHEIINNHRRLLKALGRVSIARHPAQPSEPVNNSRFSQSSVLPTAYLRNGNYANHQEAKKTGIDNKSSRLFDYEQETDTSTKDNTSQESTVYIHDEGIQPPLKEDDFSSLDDLTAKNTHGIASFFIAAARLHKRQAEGQIQQPGAD